MAIIGKYSYVRKAAMEIGKETLYAARKTEKEAVVSNRRNPGIRGTGHLFLIKAIK
jgi:hypothetical protein